MDTSPTGSTRGRVDGWALYLLVAVALVPVLVLVGPAQTAIIDPLNVIGIGVFLAAALVKRKAVRVPFAVPVLLISLGSLIAVFNAKVPGESFITLAQDVYLYLWFIFLVNVMRGRQELTGFRIAWVYVADVVAVLGIGLLLFEGPALHGNFTGPKGLRATGTFYDANTFASYLVLSLFIVLSLGQEIGRILKWGSLALIGTALLATKSNAGVTSLAAGLLLWVPLRVWAQDRSPVRLAAAMLLVVAAATGIWWLNSGWGVGSAQVRAIQTESFLARSTHSSDERSKIWGQLLRIYWKTPLGIGPGNSKWQTLSVEERERRDSSLSKEAHNDYLGYLIERGPLALLGLLLLQGQAFAGLAAWWRQRRERNAPRGPDGALLAAAAGALVAWMVLSLTHETLHFRHYWMFLAMLCALDGGEVGERGSARLALT